MGDALQGDVQHALVDEPRPGVLGAIARAALRPVVLESSGQQSLTGDRNGHTACVDCDPPPAPLFGDIRRGAAATRRIKDQIARIRGHQKTALNDLWRGLYYVL